MKKQLKKWAAFLLAIVQIVTMTSVLCLDISATEGGSASSLVDFVVDVESGRDIRVLQITDPQTIDASQQRSVEGALEEVLALQWAPDTEERNAYQYIRGVVENYQPDLILMTGDLVYGSRDDNGTRLVSLINFMESLQIPWAPVFGNHENESHMGADWQCEQMEKAEYCLFKQRELTGNGNYTVGITQGGKLVRVFYMMDTNGCFGMSAATAANGHSKATYGFGQDQIDWYTESIQAVKAADANTKISMAFHAPMKAFEDAFKAAGVDVSTINETPVDLDADSDASTIGYMGQWITDVWDTDYSVWNSSKTLGVDSIFVGHLHCNSGSVEYDGIRVTFGLKSSTYDQTLYYDESGNRVFAYAKPGNSVPIIGGTAIDVASTGTLNVYHIYYDELSENETVVDNTTCIKLQDVESAKYGANLNTGLFSKAMTETQDAPAGFGGTSVYAAKGVTNNAWGSIVTVDLEGQDLTNKTIYLRYYITDYTPVDTAARDWRFYPNQDVQNSANKTVNGTDLMFFKRTDLEFGKWVDMDITVELLNAMTTYGCTDFGIAYISRLAGSSTTCDVYIDGLYVVTPEADSMLADSEVIKLDTVETEKKGANLGLFADLKTATVAPAGYSGNTVVSATSEHQVGSNGGVEITFDLSKKYDLTGKTVYLRYYIPSHTTSNGGKWDLGVNTYIDPSNTGATGTDKRTSQISAVFDQWVNMDITSLLAQQKAFGCTDVCLFYWAGLTSGSSDKCTVYIDGIYLVSKSDPILENAEYINIDDIDTEATGANLKTLFDVFEKTTDMTVVPEGYNGTTVFDATTPKTYGASMAITVDREALQGKKVYLRYYIDGEKGATEVSWRLTTNTPTATQPNTGTNYMPMVAVVSAEDYGRWVNLDITATLESLFVYDITDCGIVLWLTETHKVYIDGLYVVAPTADEIPAGAQPIKLNDYRVDAVGNNLSSLFVGMTETTDAPYGFSGDTVYAATTGYIGGTNGGTCLAVNLAALNLKGDSIFSMEGRKVYLRYYIPSFTSDEVPTIKFAENEGNKRGTDNLPFSTPDLAYDRWAMLDITEGVWDYLVAKNQNGFAITFWPVLSGSNTATMYIDGLYITEPTDPWADESIDHGTQNTYIVSGSAYNLMNCDTGRSVMLGDIDEFTLVAEAGTNMYSIKNGDSYVDLSTVTPTLSDTKQLVMIYPCANDRYQIVINGNQILADDDNNSTVAASLNRFGRSNTGYIQTGWYITKSGDTRPIKVMPLGDSITYGVDDITLTASDMRVGYRKQLSENLNEYFGRVVFVGDQKTVNKEGKTAAVTLDDKHLLRHAGYPGYVIENDWDTTGLDATNASRPGIKGFVDTLTAKYTPDIVCLMIGTNDLGMIDMVNGDDTELLNAWLPKYRAFVEQIAATLEENDTVLCSTITPNVGEGYGASLTATANKGIKTIVHELNNSKIVLADNYTAVAAVTDAHADAVHLTPAGYAAMAQEWTTIITNAYKADGTRYVTLADRFAAAQEGDTVTLVGAETVKDLTVNAGVTLDLNGNTITAESLTSFGNIVDSTEGEGLVKIAKNETSQPHLILNTVTTSLPLYDAADGGYRFFTPEFEHQEKKLDDPDKVKYAIRVGLSEKGYALLDDADNYNALSVCLKLTKDGEDFKTINYSFKQTTVEEYVSKSTGGAGKKYGLMLTVSGLEAAAEKGITLSASAQLSFAGMQTLENAYAQGE